MSRPTFKQRDVERAIRGAQAGGLTVEAVEISAEGSIRVLTRRPLPGVPLNDDDDWVNLAGATKDHGRAHGA